MVVGAPIPVPKVEHPTDEEVDRVHATYVAALTNLYEGINSTHLRILTKVFPKIFLKMLSKSYTTCTYLIFKIGLH